MFLEHVNLSVSDIDRTIAFYGELFGFRVRWRGVGSDGEPAAHVGDDRCYLALFQADPNVPIPERDEDGVGFNHVGFVVEDLDEMRLRLTKLGVEPHHEADYEPGRRLYFLDPDGFEVELVLYGSPSESVAVRGEAS